MKSFIFSNVSILIKVKNIIISQYILMILMSFVSIVYAQNVTYSSLFNTSTFDAKTINVNLPVGNVPGSANVTTSGGSNYSIPISTPAGTNQISPSLSINYNSQAGNGPLGMGWSISGVSYITRTSQNFYLDGQVTPIKMDNDDRFTLDGHRLILKSGINGENNSKFGKEIEDFSEVTAKGTQGYGPQWFEVITKEGIKMEYGNTPDSRHTGDYATVLTWGLNKIQYPDGNYITFKYKSEAFESLIEEINYTGNDLAGISPYNKIKFDYKLRTIDSNTGFVADTRVDSKYLLDKITTSTENQTVLIYQLNYGHDNINSFLKEVQLSSSDGSALNSTIFQYGDLPLEFSTATTPGYENSASLTLSGDYNGDGLTDFLAAVREGSNYKMTVYTKNALWSTNPNDYFVAAILNLPATYQVVKKMDIPNSYGISTYDFTGDGADDIVITDVSGSGANAVLNKINIYQTIQNYDYATNGNPPISFSTATFVSPYSGYYKIHTSGNFLHIGDFNGDGIQDMLTTLGNSGNLFQAHIYYGNISSTFLTVGTTGSVNIPITEWAGASEFRVIDFNGDRKSDIMIIKNGYCEIFTFDGYNAHRIYITLAHQGLGSCEFKFGDFNGDQKTDILSRDIYSNQWRILISNGFQFNVQDFTFNFTPDMDQYSGDHVVVADFNGDGKSDILHARDPSGSFVTYLDVYYNKGYDATSGILPFHYINVFYTLNLGAPPPIIGDFNGDGKADAVNFKNDTTPMDLFYFRKDGLENHLIKVKNGHGHKTEWDYKKLTSNTSFYLRGNLTSLPLNTVQPAIFAVSNFYSSSSNTSNFITAYSYEGARFHRGGKGFLGFTKITKVDPMGIRTVTENLFNTTYFTQYPYKKSSYLMYNNALLDEVTYTTAFVSPSSKRFWMKTTETFNNKIHEGSSSSTTDTWDNFGNILTSTNTVSGGSNLVETNVTTNVYSAFTTSIPNQITSQTTSKTRPGESTFSLTTTYGYNSIGQLTSKTNFYGLPKSINTTYEYFDFGSLKKTTVTPTGMNPKVNSMTYDSKGRFPITDTNVLNQVSSTIYDAKWGKPLSSTGIDGLTTTYEYDSFGIVKKVNKPEGYSVNQSFGWDVSGTSVMYSLLSQTGKPDVKIWYDLLGREVKKEEESFPSGWVTSTKEYDLKGNLKRETVPSKTGETGVRKYDYQYDNLNRLYRVYDDGNQEAGETIYTHSYSSGDLLFSTALESYNPADSKVSHVTIDASGKTISAMDNGGTINYKYYSHGGIKEIKQGSIVISSSTFDQYGQQVSATDINAGTTTFDYNTMGQITSQVNPNGQTTSFIYDSGGKMSTRTGPEGTTTYESFNSGVSINKLKKVTGFSGNIQEYAYNSLGYLSTITETIDATAYTTSYTYNTYGDVSTVSYPSGFGIKYNYDGNGFISTIKNSNESITIFTNGNMNGAGQTTSYSMGNGKSSTISYKYGYPLSYLTSGVQNLELTWNYGTGSISKRKDVIKAKEESFVYDNLNRLTQSTILGETGQTVSYSPNGNISAKTEIGNYSYGSKPNAVIQVSNSSNTVSSLTQNVSYTPFQQPSVITENNFELGYTYGADYERIKSVKKENGSVINTKYYFSGFDKNITGSSTKFIHYIIGPAGLACIVVRENTTDTYNYVYTDHLGSILTTTNSGGTVTTEQNFDAWGRRRNTATWALLSPTASTGLPDWLFRGYTAHEHLDNFGLINMNGRLYDPVVARVLSPDNYVQDPYSTQDYNRYSYSKNNPLVYSDPDGEWIQYAIGAAVGGFTGWRIGKAAGAKGWEMAGYITGGAAIGAFTGGLGHGMLEAFGSVATSGMTLGQSILAYGVTGAVTGGFSGGAYAALAGNDFWPSAGKGALWGGIGGSISGGMQYANFLNKFYDSPYFAQDGNPKYAKGSYSTVENGVIVVKAPYWVEKGNAIGITLGTGGTTGVLTGLGLISTSLLSAMPVLLQGDTNNDHLHRNLKSNPDPHMVYTILSHPKDAAIPFLSSRIEKYGITGRPPHQERPETQVRRLNRYSKTRTYYWEKVADVPDRESALFLEYTLTLRYAMRTRGQLPPLMRYPRIKL